MDAAKQDKELSSAITVDGTTETTVEGALSAINTVAATAASNALTLAGTSGVAEKLNASLKGANNGVAELDASGKVPSSQLPSFVDDVIEAYYNTTDGKFYEESTYTTEITGESGKIYVDLTSNKTYRWGGSAYAEISESLALGETSTTAYRGDRGKTAYDHSQLQSGNPHGVTKADVGLGNVENKSAATIISEITNSDVMSALAPTSGDAGKYLKADGTFDNPQATVVADQTMDSTSTNAVANAAVCAAIDDVKTLLGNVTGTYNSSTRVLTLNIVGS